MTHPYWGTIENDWAGYSSDVYFKHPFFGDTQYTIFLGEALDEEGEEIEEPPTLQDLEEYQKTYTHFIESLDKHLAEIQQKAFDRYLKLYAHYYENPKKSGEPAKGIDTIETHTPYIKELMHLRLSKGKELRLTIRYTLDTEHGIEFLFQENKLQQIGGIADT